MPALAGPDAGTPSQLIPGVRSTKERGVKSFLRGALIGVVGSFPLAGLSALLFRFPIPFDAYRSGVDAVVPALGAVVFYGFLGGFVVQGVLGGLGGLIAATLAPDPPGPGWRRRDAWSLAAASTGVLTLALLDRIVGPW